MTAEIEIFILRFKLPIHVEAKLEERVGGETETSNRLVGRILKPIGKPDYYIWDGTTLYYALRKDFKEGFVKARNGEYFSFKPEMTEAKVPFAKKIKIRSKVDREIHIYDELIKRFGVSPVFFRDDLPVYLAEVSYYNCQTGSGEIILFKQERKMFGVIYLKISCDVIDGDTLRQRQIVEFQIDPKINQVVYVRPIYRSSR